MRLNDITVKNAKKSTKAYKLADGDGMYLLVQPTGAKYWRLKYRFGGKERLLALGVYPDVSLQKARRKRRDARDMLEEGRDPSKHRREEKRASQLRGGNTFQAIALDWHAKQKVKWTERHADYVLKRMKADLFSEFGNAPIADIGPTELLDALRKIEKRGACEIAHRALQVAGAVFRYAILVGRAKHNPAGDLKGALEPVVKKHMARVDAKELPDLLRKMDKYEGEPITKIALKLMAHTFVRTGELIGARWSEVDLDKKEWRIPAERMKARVQHIVPLSDQAVVLMEELQRFTGERAHLFHSTRTNKPISNNTILFALYRMGYRGKMTGHGFRGVASTTLNEKGYNADVIERQLAHAERDAVRAAYNYAQYLPERRRMMQDWSNYLDGLQAGASVTPIKKKVA